MGVLHRISKIFRLQILKFQGCFKGGYIAASLLVLDFVIVWMMIDVGSNPRVCARRANKAKAKAQLRVQFLLTFLGGGGKSKKLQLY